MNCYKCGKDRNYFNEITMVRVHENLPKKPVCVYCMGWKKEVTDEHIIEIDCPVCGKPHLYDTRHLKDVKKRAKTGTTQTVLTRCLVKNEKFEFNSK